MKYSLCLSVSPTQFDAIPLEGDFAKNVKKVAELGFDGVELAIRDPLLIDKEKILRELNQYGLVVPVIGTGQAWGEEGLSFTDPDPQVRKKAVYRVISHFDFAAETGAVIIIGLLRGVANVDVSAKDANQWIFEAFSHCCEEAQKQNVRIAFEPINRYETSFINCVRDGLSLIEKVGAPNLGMVLDTFHMNIEEPCIAESIKLAGSKMFHLHYADSNRMYPGAGHIDFKSVIQAAQDIGYTGYFSGEHRPDPEGTMAAANGLNFLRKIEKEMKKSSYEI
jgi:sugar phosphate isomerase/epimerase